MAKRTGKASAGLIRSIPLFHSISDQSCSDLAAASTLRQFAARTILFNEGASAEKLYIVVRGSAELFSEQDERYCTLAVVPAVKPLALYAVLSERSPLSARILEPSELVAVPIKLVVDLFGKDPAFAAAVMQELASECHELVEDSKSHRLRSTIERVAHWMLRADRKSGDTGHIVIPFDKRVLASYLGMAPEHLSRSFHALTSAGVAVHGRSVTLSDRAALSEAAGMDVPERFLQLPNKKP
jgi:CRP/FNR family transcriptional regulator, transcriptional activator FtrB